MVRAFIALEISDEIRAGLAQAQDVLRQCRARLTFVAPPLIHITVKFLGEIDDRKAGDVAAALRGIRFSPFAVTAGRVTVNNPRRPFTVWCAIDDGGKGASLQGLVEDALAPLGFPRENRPFTAHATVARVKGYDPSLMEAIGKLERGGYGSCMISGLKFKKSILTPAGPVYGDLAEVLW
jgi:2'-5' RNA ligase